MFKRGNLSQNPILEMASSMLKYVDVKRASGMIKFLAGSCLSVLGIVLKEP
jgi:ribosomal protein L11